MADDPKHLYTNLIQTDGGTQIRCSIDDSVVNEYAELYAAGKMLPPVTVFFDGAKYWLADGFHRLEAVGKKNMPMIDVDVHHGTLRDAILYAVGANAAHGKRRTNEDKRNAVSVLLKDDDWKGWSDHRIADQCGVSQPFVTKLRKELSDNGYKMDDEHEAMRNGKAYSQKARKQRRDGDTPKAERKQETYDTHQTVGSGSEANGRSQRKASSPEELDLLGDKINTYIDEALQVLFDNQERHIVVTNVLKYLKALSSKYNQEITIEKATI